jgi:F-type H+-transporting ATPase subunit delta
MKNQTLVKRYTEGLAAALSSPAEYKAVGRELGEFEALLNGHEGLNHALLRPFLNAAKKVRIMGTILDAQAGQVKTKRFLLLLLRHGRMELLPEILAALPVVWRERQGIQSFEVSSVVPLRSEQKARLEAELAGIEKRPVSCTYALDPALLGGLSVRRGNFVYDVSLKGQLDRLKNKISER